MNDLEPEIDPFVDALKSDMPSPGQEARVRARLAAAGLAMTAGLGAPAAVAGLKAGFMPKLAALPMTAKVGLATAAVTVAAVPVTAPLWSGSDSAAIATSAARVAPHPKGPSVSNAAAAEAAVSAVQQTPRESPRQPQTLPETPARGAPGRRVASPSPTRVSTASKTQAQSVAEEDSASAVVSFPSLAESPAAQSTLREETALLESAFGALSAGERERARSLLEDHASRYPYGLLAPERQRAFERLREQSQSEPSRGSADH